MKKLLMIVMLVGLIAMAGVPAQANSIGHNLVGHVLPAAEPAGAPGYSQGFWNNSGDNFNLELAYDPVTGNYQEGPGTHTVIRDNTGAVVAGMSITWLGTLAYSAPAAGGTQGDNWMLNWMLAALNTAATVDVTNIPYASYDVVAYVPSNWPERGNAVSVTGDPTTYYNYAPGDFSGTYTQITSTTPGDLGDKGNYALFTGLTSPSLTISVAANPGAGLGDYGSIAGFQIIDTTPEEEDPVIPEPAGLGLIGLALLAVRKRRS